MGLVATPNRAHAGPRDWLAEPSTGLGRYRLGGLTACQALEVNKGGGLIQLSAPLAFTRAGNADYIDRSLEFAVAGTNEPRIQFDPAGVLPPRLLVEDEAQNKDGTPFASTGWAASSVSLSVATLLGKPAITIDVADVVPAVAFAYETFAGLTPGSRQVYSFFAKRGTATDLSCVIYDATNAAWIIAPTDAAADVSSQVASGKVGRVRQAFTVPAGCTQVRCYPARFDVNTGSAGTFTVTGTQLEADVLTSLIASNGTPTTRSPEAASVPLLHGGGPFTLLLDCYLGAVPTSGFARIFEAVRISTGVDDRQSLVWNPSTNKLRLSMVRGGASVVASDLTLGPTGRARLAVAYTNSDVSISVNGSTVEDRTGISGLLPAVDRLHLLQGGGGGEAFPGESGVSQCTVIPGVVPDADLQAWSTLP